MLYRHLSHPQHVIKNWTSLQIVTFHTVVHDQNKNENNAPNVMLTLNILQTALTSADWLLDASAAGVASYTIPSFIMAL